MYIKALGQFLLGQVLPQRKEELLGAGAWQDLGCRAAEVLPEQREVAGPICPQNLSLGAWYMSDLAVTMSFLILV